jgi:transglutaminase-like putative cysteine protease
MLVAEMDVTLFIKFIVVYYFLSILKLALWKRSLIISLTGFYLLREYYYNSIFSWVFKLIRRLASDTFGFFHGDFLSAADQTLTFYMLLGLGIGAFLVEYLILKKHAVKFLVVLLIIYIGALDAFTGYFGNVPIIRLVVLSLLVFSLIRMSNLKVDFRWLIPVSVFISILVTSGYFLPKHKAMLPDPVPFMEKYITGKEKGSGAAVSGLDGDDRKLGGDLVQSNEVVFHAEINRNESPYWRVGVKDFYTGKGWTMFNDGEEFDNGVGNQFDFFDSLIYKNFKEDTTARVTLSKESKQIFFPNNTVEIQFPDQIGTTKNYTQDSLSVSEYFSVKKYTVVYPRLNYIETELRAADKNPWSEITPDDKIMYTRLPSILPDRVKDLSQKIVTEANATTNFDKVKAIENFLRSGEYVYDTKNVPYPSRNQDYVDQFLFETKRGYCNNFSTAMIVLLRAQDIPARWVKGYASGEFVERIKGGTYKYIVKERDAHSWVEVFFSGIGWVEFEPTVSFDRLETVEKEKKPIKIGKEEPVSTVATPKKVQKDNVEVVNKGNPASFEINPMLLFCYILVFAGVIYGIWSWRTRWIPSFYVMIFKYWRNDRAFVAAYTALLAQLYRLGLERRKGQTLSDFSRIVDHHFETIEMTALTREYERLIYNNGTDADWYKQWSSIISKVSI